MVGFVCGQWACVRRVGVVGCWLMGACVCPLFQVEEMGSSALTSYCAVGGVAVSTRVVWGMLCQSLESAVCSGVGGCGCGASVMYVVVVCVG